MFIVQRIILGKQGANSIQVEETFVSDEADAAIEKFTELAGERFSDEFLEQVTLEWDVEDGIELAWSLPRKASEVFMLTTGEQI